MGSTDDRRRRDEAWDAAAIRRLRRHAGFSQRELADQLNARQQTVSEWERGAYAPRGTAARLLTRVAEDVAFPFQAGSAAGATVSMAGAGEAEESGAGDEAEASEPAALPRRSDAARADARIDPDEATDA